MRLVFAEMAARAIGQGGFDALALDLPFFMNANEWLEIPIDTFPFVSSLIVRVGDEDYRTYNFVPNDAACAALHLVYSLREMGQAIHIECLDDSNIINYAQEYFTQPELVLRDDFFALSHGLEAYFAPVYRQLEKSWPLMSEETTFFWDYRARIVVRRLDDLLKKGKKTLFVCNYRLWWLVHRKLSAGDFETESFLVQPWHEQQAALVFQDPYFLWIKGVMDDYPAVVFRFFQESLLQGAGAVFDKLDVLNETILQSLEAKTRSPGRHFSIRRLELFRQYLLRRLAVNQRITPALTSYLDHAERSCLGKMAALKLSRELLAYPLPDDFGGIFLTIRQDHLDFADSAFEIPDAFSQSFLNSVVPNDMSNLFGDRMNSERDRERLVSCIRPFLTKKESLSLPHSIGTTWALKDEYILYAQANRVLWEVIERESHRFRVVKSWGSLSNGIDWKETLWSRARGEDAIYVKKAIKTTFNAFDLNVFTPTIFIFDQTGNERLSAVYDSNILKRTLDLEEVNGSAEISEPDFVYSIFYTKKDSEHLCDGHIRKEIISTLLFLYTESWMGLERYANITKRPLRFQCRQYPDQDQDLNPFDYPDKLVACGIKYAERIVIVVSRPSWEPSPLLLSFAKMRNVHIKQIDLSALSPEMIDRMQTIHLMSTPLKKHPNSESIVDRFVEDVW